VARQERTPVHGPGRALTHCPVRPSPTHPWLTGVNGTSPRRGREHTPPVGLNPVSTRLHNLLPWPPRNGVNLLKQPPAVHMPSPGDAMKPPACGLKARRLQRANGLDNTCP